MYEEWLAGFIEAKKKPFIIRRQRVTTIFEVRVSGYTDSLKDVLTSNKIDWRIAGRHLIIGKRAHVRRLLTLILPHLKLASLKECAKLMLTGLDAISEEEIEGIMKKFWEIRKPQPLSYSAL